MTETTSRLSFNQESFESFLQSRQDPGWLVELRQAAWKTFNQIPWPNRNDEEWIRSDIRLFNLSKFALPLEAPQTATPAAALSAGVELAGSSISLNSHSIQSRMAPKWAEQGVLFGSLNSFLATHGDLIRPHLLCQAVNPHYDKFSALHSAFFTGGHFLYVPRGIVVDQPFHALSAMTDGGVDLGHTLVVLEEDAEATLLSETASSNENDNSFECSAVELIQSPGSRLRFVNLQDWGPKVWRFAHQKAIVQRDASLQWTIAALGGRFSKVNQHVALTGEGANCQVNGVMFTQNKQHISYHTLQHHEAPHCRSDFLYKAALQDKSRTVWRGMIKVDPAAQLTNGYQRNDNLLLSSNARADSIPGLEIEADDVRCTHGSTSGKIDEELIFYAQCRGLSRQEAIRIVVTGFFQQIFDRITIESVREALASAIALRVREYE